MIKLLKTNGKTKKCKSSQRKRDMYVHRENNNKHSRLHNPESKSAALKFYIQPKYVSRIKVKIKTFKQNLKEFITSSYKNKWIFSGRILYIKKSTQIIKECQK